MSRPESVQRDAFPLEPEFAAQSVGGRSRVRGLHLAQRIYALRVVGLALGMLGVAAVLHENGGSRLAWAALLANGLAWPHIAHFFARRNRNPYRAEMRNLLADSAFGGAWVALMAFNALPSVLLVVMLSMDKLSVGGIRLFLKSAAAQLAGGTAAALLFGFQFRPETTMVVVLACVPLLVVYPLGVGVVTYRLLRRVRDQNRTLAALSRTDGLTGVANRTHWVETVGRELARHRRSGQPASLLMLDLDYFKAINDRHGHPAGDDVIRGAAAILRELVRQHDTIGRYGGEEFGIVLPDTDAEGAWVIAERIRMRISAAVLERRAGIRCTVSIGIAALAEDIMESREWIERADRALYRAKALGRDRTERAGAAETSSIIAGNPL